MITPSRADLLGYLLGALEVEERQQVEQCLQAQPDLHRELQRIKAKLRPLQACQRPPAELPTGLARRTCEIVSREIRTTASRQPSAQVDGVTADGLGQPSSELTSPARKTTRTVHTAALACFAAFCGALMGPLAFRLTQGSPEWAGSNTAIAVRPVTGDRINRNPRIPTLRSELLNDSFLLADWAASDDAEPISANTFFAKSSPWRDLENTRMREPRREAGILRLASRPNAFSRSNVSDTWENDSAIQFISE